MAFEFQDPFDAPQYQAPQQQEGPGFLGGLARVMGAVGAGIQGRTPPYILEQQAAEAQHQKNVDNYFQMQQVFKSNLEYLERVPFEERPAAAKFMARRMNQVVPGSGDALQIFSQTEPAVWKGAMAYFGDPVIADKVTRIFGNDPKRFYPLITQPETLNAFLRFHDQQQLPTVLTKLRKILTDPSVASNVPPDVLAQLEKNEDGFTLWDMGTFQQINEYLGANKFTTDQLGTLDRNQGQLISLGIVPTKTREEFQKKRMLEGVVPGATLESGQPTQVEISTGKRTAIGAPRPVGTTITNILPTLPNPGAISPQTIQNDYRAAPGVKKFQQLRQNYTQMAKTYTKEVGGRTYWDDKGNPTTDAALVRAWVQAHSPEQDRAVTSEEVRRMYEMGSLPAAVLQWVKTTIYEGKRLNEGDRKDVFKSFVENFDIANQEQAKLEKQFQDMMVQTPEGKAEYIRTYSIPKKGVAAPTNAAAEQPGFASMVLEFSRRASAQGFDQNQIDKKVQQQWGNEGVKILTQERMKINSTRKGRSSRGAIVYPPQYPTEE